MIGKGDLNGGEGFLQLLGQICAYRIFCMEVSGIDQLETQMFCVPELIVFCVCCYKGIAAGTDSLEHFPGAGTATYRNAADWPITVYIAKTLTAEGCLDMRKKLFQRLAFYRALAQKSPRSVCIIYTFRFNDLNIIQP